MVMSQNRGNSNVGYINVILSVRESEKLLELITTDWLFFDTDLMRYLRDSISEERKRISDAMLPQLVYRMVNDPDEGKL